MLRPEVLKELDRLLADPDYRRQAATAIRPSFYGKLLVAATDQSALVLDKALAAGVFKHVASISDTTVPRWARLGAINALGTWCHGEGYTCAHNPSFELPQPVFAAAWKPGLVACIRCTGLMSVPQGSDLDRTCDGPCGQVVARIRPSAVQLAAFTWSFGSCPNCEVKGR